MIARQKLKHAFKVVVAHGLYLFGILHLWQSIVMRRKAVVLMYHRVLTQDEQRQSGSHPALVVGLETFRRQMALLHKRFVVLSVHEFAHRIENKIPFENSTCVITFDDGWLDNYTNALPVLREHRFPALVFLPVNYVGGRRLFWQEALTHLLTRVVVAVRLEPSRRREFEAVLASAGVDALIDARDSELRMAIDAAIVYLKRCDRAVVNRLLDELAASLGVALDALGRVDRFIDWEHVASMSRQGITFGGHGAEHLLLTHISSQEAEAEIRLSKETINEKLCEPVPTFSYPNGYFDEAIASQVRASGYRLAFITTRGLVSSDGDPFQIPRLNVHEDVTRSGPMFLARILGIF